jgi:glycosyltransferase involved in cell wall biosynthesis
MKILFLTDNFPPEVNAPATRTYEHCKKWIEMGHEVTVITCFPNFPQGKVYNGYRNKLYQKEVFNGIRVIRIWSYITANKGFIKRSLDQLSFAFTSFLAGLFVGKFDYIVATSPQFFTSWSGYLLSKFKRTPWLFEVRDMWPEGIIFLDKSSKLYKILEKIELGLYKSASKIVTVTQGFKESIIQRAKIEDNKIVVVYNGSNNKKFTIKEKNKELLNNLNLENKFIVGYAGTFGMSHSLEFIFQEISKVKNPYIHFLFLGDGAMKSSMIKWVEEYNLLNVTILESVAKDKIVDYISIFDIGLVPLAKNDAYLRVIPSKTFELTAMGKPILLGVEGEMKSIIERYNAGIAYEPENSKEFQIALDILYNNRDNFLNIYQNGLNRISQEFDRELLATKMIEFMSR